MAEGGVSYEFIARAASLTLAMKKKEDERRGTRVQLTQVQVLRELHNSIKSETDTSASMVTDPVTMANLIADHVHISTTPVKDLKRVGLRDLLLETSAVGSYVVVRILESGIQSIGWSSVIEDDRGDGCFIDVYNYPPRELFCPGTVLIIKEPFYKLSFDGYPFIRCDCPTNIIVVHRSHKFYEMVENVKWVNEVFQRAPHETLVLEGPLTTSAKEWKELGNRLCSDGHWSLAREAYRLGLMRCSGTSDPTWRAIQSEMTSVYLELGYYEDTIATFGLIPDDWNALFRAGRAHYQLRHYVEAENLFSMFHARYPEAENGGKELLRAQRRIQEQSKGYPSLSGLEADRRRSQVHKMDHADFIGCVKLTKVPDGVDGVVVTQNVKKGVILMVCKAFSATLTPKKPVDYLMILIQKVDFNRVSIEMVSEITQAIARNPRTFGPVIYKLCDKPYELFCDSDTEDEPISDVKKIKSICNWNNVPIPNSDGGPLGAGLFVFPSHINHSCEPNVEAIFYNDVMVIRTTQRLRNGAEVLMSYIPLGLEDSARKMMLQQRGLRCICRLCQPQPPSTS